LSVTGAATGVLTGGRVTVQDAVAYANFARGVLGTSDVDFRARVVSAEETAFLAQFVAGSGLGVTYGDLEAAANVLLVAFDPEDESPIVFLRLRKAALAGGTKVYSVAPFRSAGLAKMKGTLLPAGPADEVAAVKEAAQHIGAGSIIMVGERACHTPGLLSAVAQVAAATGARLAWVPRRAGDRGAVDAGLLPIGGRDTSAIIAAAGGVVKGLLIGGVSADDVDGDLVSAVKRSRFTVSLETRHTAITEHADVVLPVAVVTEKAGTYRNWEGRDRSFQAVTPVSGMLSDADILGELAREMERPMQPSDFWSDAERPTLTAAEPRRATVGSGQALLATWRHLLDRGSLQEGEPYLAATARAAVIRVSPRTSAALGLTDGGLATVVAEGVKVVAPVIETAGMVDGVVWAPSLSEDSRISVPAGTVVSVHGGAS
jgi:NADH-quinone oxidoreductase subunit G